MSVDCLINLNQNNFIFFIHTLYFSLILGVWAVPSVLTVKQPSIQEVTLLRIATVSIATLC